MTDWHPTNGTMPDVLKDAPGTMVVVSYGGFPSRDGPKKAGSVPWAEVTDWRYAYVESVVR